MELLTTKKIDELGRIRLPEKSRKEMGWSAGDTVSVYQMDKNTLILQLSEKCLEPKCVICRRAEKAVNINGSDICESCLDEIKKI